MADTTSLGDRQKAYENIETSRTLIPTLPIIARIDGKSFHTFTKGLKRPYDEGMSQLMVETTKALVGTTHARIGYTQSDEITLVFHADSFDSETYFNGRTFKLVSVLASIATATFNSLKSEYIPIKKDVLAYFDCRVWNVPNKMEAVNCLIWRERDATKNSISMAAQSVFSHAQLMNKNGSEMQEMLFRQGINWNNYPTFFKRGTYVGKRHLSRKLTSEELSSLPPMHDARKNPNMVVTRSWVDALDMPVLAYVLNPIDVIFEGMVPLQGQ